MPRRHSGFFRDGRELRKQLSELYDAVHVASTGTYSTHPLETVRAKIHLYEIWAADRTSRSLARATWALVFATVTLVAATVVLAVVG